MKIKKLLSVLLISAVVMVPSASAFAEDVNSTEIAPTGTVTPYIVGVGDTRATAVSIVLNDGGGAIYDLFIQSPTDQDWFKWTNTSSSYKRVVPRIGGMSGNGPTRAGLIVSYINQNELGPLYTAQAGTAEGQLFSNVMVPPGATVYLVVDAPNFTTAPAYRLNFAVYD
ncbi:hypothetical protein [Paenibacillus graminis]|uniref:hypothetical protein n=1 Tax=Paenibacillus graminis TaxID=189425 RepID=UPI00046FE225|nr:hypothetical protein [Paenibacillus graminis]